MGAGAARKLAPVSLPRLVKAMVDSGATVSVVRMDVVRKLLRYGNRREDSLLDLIKHACG